MHGLKNEFLGGKNCSLGFWTKSKLPRNQSSKRPKKILTGVQVTECFLKFLLSRYICYDGEFFGPEFFKMSKKGS